MKIERQALITDLLQMMSRPRDISQALAEALRQTGETLGVDRVYLSEDSRDASETFLFLEWCAVGVNPRAKESPLFRYADFPSWRTGLEQDGMIYLSPGAAGERTGISDNGSGQFTPVDLQSYIDVWEIAVLIAMPIHGAENRLFGFLGLEENARRQGWGEEEFGLLRDVCAILSGAVRQLELETAERQQRLLTKAMLDTTRAMAGALNFDEVLDRVLTNLGMVVQSDAARIGLVDEEGIVRFVRWRGYDQAAVDLMRRDTFHVSEREIYRFIALTNEPIVIVDTGLDKRWQPQPELAWVRCHAGAPIIVNGKLVGLLNMDSREPSAFQEDINDRLRLFVDQAAVAINNARWYKLAQTRVDEMAMLYRIGLSLTANMGMDQVLASLYEHCRSVLPMDVFYVLIYEAQKETLTQGICYQDGEMQVIEPHILADIPELSGMVIRGRRTVVIHDTFTAEAQERYKMRRQGEKPTRSYVAVPLIVLDQVVGVISMQNYQPNAYSGDQVKLLETIATQAAIAVQNTRLYENLRKMAITDSLTQLSTRHHFTAMGESEVERAVRYSRSLSVLLVDVDRFKVVNDTYGHYAGDAVLQMVARTCSQALRATDLVGRWGGEEFAILLPEADLDGAMMIAERVRRMIEEHEIVLADGQKARVTVSLGVATLGKGLEKLETLLDCADRAMLQAKQAGRNRARAWQNRPVQAG